MPPISPQTRRRRSLAAAISTATVLFLWNGTGAAVRAATPHQDVSGKTTVLAEPANVLETAWTFQFPRPNYAAASYAGRDFLRPSNHLGEDSAHPHLAPVYAIANGVVKVSRTAQGYGRAVVIEHRLPDGSYVTSIYGHLCSHAGYPLIPNGSYVTKGQLVGYIGSDIENGDGSEHLHLGIRIGRYDGYFCGYTGLSQCTASRYHRPTEFINARRDGMTINAGISLAPSSPVINNPIAFALNLRNNHYYGGNFAFRFRISSGSTVLVTSSEVTRWLNPGDSAALTFTWSSSAAGTYQATIELRAPGTETWWPIPASGSGGNPRSFTVANGNPTGSLPVAPSNLTVRTDSVLRAILFWNDNSNNETGFKIERRIGLSGTWGMVTTLGAGATGYVDQGLAPNTTYSYRVRATNAFGDSLTSNEASVTTGAGACSTDITPISPGQSLSGNLSATDCYNSVRTTSYHDRFTFLATAGVSYTIQMSSTQLDSYLVLRGHDGAVVAQNDDADGTRNSRIIHTAATSGTYVIEATSYGGGTTGAYTVSLAAAGGGPSLPVAPSNLSVNTDSTLRALLSWSDNSTNETGFKIERRIGSSGTWSPLTMLGAGATSYADVGLAPNTTYAYRVRATNASGDSPTTNEVSVTTGVGACGTTSTPISPGQSVSGTLSSTDCLSSVRTSSYHDRFSFTATAGVSYTIQMSSTQLDSYLVLRGQGGAIVAQNDDIDGTPNSRIIHTAATSGTYIIEATSYGRGSTGTYIVSLAASGSGSGCTSSTILLTPGQNSGGDLETTDCFSTERTSSYHDRFVFAATAGVTYTITMIAPSFDAYLVLRGPSGSTVATNDDVNGSTHSRIIYTAPVSGNYLIEATSYNAGATGIYAVSLTN